jgi:hypothetical protein
LHGVDAVEVIHYKGLTDREAIESAVQGKKCSQITRLTLFHPC